MQDLAWLWVNPTLKATPVAKGGAILVMECATAATSKYSVRRKQSDLLTLAQQFCKKAKHRCAEHGRRG